MDFFGIILKKDHRKKIFEYKIESFFGKYLKECHREFGVPGNVFLQKIPE